MRRPALLAGLVVALTLLPATAAVAHPSFNPNQVPVGEPVEAVLVVPHGCSTADEVMPEEGQAVPTTRFDLQQVEGVRIEPGDVDGWDVSTDGEALVWTDAGGATTGPIELPVTVTVEEGSPGDTFQLAAYQECEDGQSYRWTEGSEDTPAVRLEVADGGTGPSEMDAGGMSDGTEDAEASGPAEAGTEAAAAAAAADDEGLDGATVAAIMAIVVAVGAGVYSLVRRKGVA